MTTFLVSILIFSTPIGRDVPTEVTCYDTATHKAVAPGAYLDAQEAIAVVQLAASYEQGCADKTLALAAHRDEQQDIAVTTSGTAGTLGGLTVGGALFLLRRKRKKGPVANTTLPMSF